MPCYNIKWRVALGALEELASKLVDNLPSLLLDLVLSLGIEEVSGVGQAIGTERTKLRELPAGSPKFQNIASNGSFRERYSDLLPLLHDTDLSRLNIERPEFGLNVQCSLLWNDHPIAVRVHERLLLHAGVCHIHMSCDTFPKGWLAGSGHSLEALNEVDFAVSWDIEGGPGQLGGREMDAGVKGQEAAFGVLVVWQIGLLQNEILANSPSNI